jgi:hypothetical protein
MDTTTINAAVIKQARELVELYEAESNWLVLSQALGKLAKAVRRLDKAGIK